MAQRLKRWESPRQEGRNVKGRGGSARQRQLRKRTQQLRHSLKSRDSGSDSSQSNYSTRGRAITALPFCFVSIARCDRNLNRNLI
jgi:hypothetical protein